MAPSLPCTVPAAPAVADAHLPHLDGLRALALLAVLCFHGKVLAVPRGYLGVDTFLVLSGFLMTRNILRAVRAGSFRFGDFYRRRFWRLYPAALATVGVTVSASFVAAGAENAREACLSALAAMSFWSNVYWWGDSNYFSFHSEWRPLLHMWSLSLEEQFYLVWPVTLVGASAVARRFGKPDVVPGVVGAAFVLSLAVMWRNWKDKNYIFYMLPPRIFEFAAGSLVQIAEGTFVIPKGAQTKASTAGLALLLFCYHSKIPTDFMATIGTLLSTSLLIATPAGLPNAIGLSSKPLRFIGHLSYSAYLTHWPLWVFGNNLGVKYTADVVWGGHSLRYTVLYFCASAITGYALHFFVERPLRFSKPNLKHRRLDLILAATILTITLAFSGCISHGWAYRFADFQTLQGEVDKLRAVCHDLANIPDAVTDIVEGVTATHGCLVGGSDWVKRARFMADKANGTKESRWVKANPVRAVVIGNSFTRHLTGALEAAFDDGPPFLVTYRDGCKLVPRKQVHVVSSHLRNLTLDNRCRYSNQRWWTLIEALPKGSTVMLGQDWVTRNEGQMILLKKRLRDLILNMHELQLRLVLITAVPGARIPYLCNDMQASKVGLVRLGAALTSCPATVTPRLGYGPAAEQQKIMAGLYSHTMDVIDVYRLICPGNSNASYALRHCPRMKEINGKHVKLYGPDLVHLSYLGSRTLGPLFKDYFDWRESHQ